MFVFSKLKKRTPIVIQRKHTTIYFKLQIYVFNENGDFVDVYNEYNKVAEECVDEVGALAIDYLHKFLQYKDLTYSDFYNLFGISFDEYKSNNYLGKNFNYMDFMDAKSEKELLYNYDECSIGYDSFDEKYRIHL